MNLINSKYIEEKCHTLSHFGIHVTSSIRQRLEELYPDEIAIENYTRSLIMQHLDQYDEPHK